MTNPTKRLIAALALALGISFTAAPAFAAIPDGPGGLTTCVDLDENGFPQCPSGDDDEDLPEQQPEEPEVDDSSDPAPVDDAIVATPNFTG
jgi:hypothetical protein